MRVVPNMPLTLALMRLLWRDASNWYTLVAGISLARAIDSNCAFNGLSGSGL